jgi:hypothetical protein
MNGSLSSKSLDSWEKTNTLCPAWVKAVRKALTERTTPLTTGW